MTDNTKTSDWQLGEDAPKDGTSFIGLSRDYDICICWWEEEFCEFISSCRQMNMAPGYTIDGVTKKLHSPVIEEVNYWQPFNRPKEN